MQLKQLLFGALLAAPFVASAQDNHPPQNWFLMDQAADGFQGVSAEKTYQELLKDRKGQTVVVAIIDSGVDIEHEDLKDVVWVNEDEIPDNGIDDDRNGYVDDVHGWNFIGGQNGNVSADQLEITRIVKFLGDKYANRDTDKLKRKERKEYEQYLKLKETVDKARTKAQASLAQFEGITESLNSIKKTAGKDDLTKAELAAFESDDEKLTQMAKGMASRLEEDQTVNDLLDQIQPALDYYSGQANAMYNVDFDGRSVVGDNYADSRETGYGNNDVEGPDALHGTHVAGIVAATRGNGIGMDGVADNVRIMSIRTVPDGDERDKDVANAIRYAVDNGASIINMSFGKGYSWDKEVVDDAVKYARKNDVLLVHAAGNSSQDNDSTDNFPNDGYEKGGFLFFGKKSADNWLEVGALDPNDGKPARFSNYGKANVDVFAPGVEIYATVPDDEYQWLQGTSMASPVVAGVAAVLRSYFPELTAEQTKEIIESTVVRSDAMVKKPGSGDEVKFSDLSKTGGVVNTYKAVQKAMQTKGKKKLTPAQRARLKDNVTP